MHEAFLVYRTDTHIHTILYRTGTLCQGSKDLGECGMFQVLQPHLVPLSLHFLSSSQPIFRNCFKNGHLSFWHFKDFHTFCSICLENTPSPSSPCLLPIHFFLNISSFIHTFTYSWIRWFKAISFIEHMQHSGSVHAEFVNKRNATLTFTNLKSNGKYKQWIIT